MLQLHYDELHEKDKKNIVVGKLDMVLIFTEEDMSNLEMLLHSMYPDLLVFPRSLLSNELGCIEHLIGSGTKIKILK